MPPITIGTFCKLHGIVVNTPEQRDQGAAQRRREACSYHPIVSFCQPCSCLPGCPYYQQ